MDNFDLKKYLAEGKLLKENTNPIWTIGADEDDADISDAGLEYIRAVSTIIQKALPDISTKDQIASMEVINNFWYDEARENAKGSEPERIYVSAIDFADAAIEHYKDVLMDKDINESQNRMFDLKKYLAEGKLLKEAFYPEFEGETNDKINDIAIAVFDELESKLDSESSGILKGMDYYVGSDGMDNDEVEQGFTKWFIDLVKYLSKNNNEVTISSVEQDGKVFTPAITLKYLDNGKEDISWEIK